MSKKREENTDSYPMINQDTVDTFQSNRGSRDQDGSKAYVHYDDLGPAPKDPGNPGYTVVRSK